MFDEKIIKKTIVNCLNKHSDREINELADLVNMKVGENK